VIGGQVGMGDNVTIQSGAVLGSGSGVLSSKIVRGGGEVYWGTPARPLREYLEGQANISKIPDLKRELAELKARMEALERREE
jgi:UDP-3-O-[3-hydroxymyristoyl] glucosamine N-acyltransferase